MTAKKHSYEVKRRTVLYFAGFDPRGASAYHSLTTEQFDRHCQQNGFESQTGKRQRVHKACHRWTLSAEGENSNTLTEFRFLVWDDLVRQYWIRPDWKSVLRGSVEFVKLVRMGFLNVTFPVAWPFVLTIGGPFFQTVAFALAGLLLLLCIFALLLGQWIVGLVGLVVAIIAMLAATRVLKSFNAPWIGRVNSFVVASAQKPIFEEWPQRKAMASYLLEVLEDQDCDEVLLVSHSLGTQTGLIALSDALKQNPELVEQAVSSGRLVFITLGQTVPMMSTITPAVTKALEVVGKSNVPWLDISSPPDPACYALVDAHRLQFGGEPRVHVQNARFFKGFCEETLRRARADRFTMHFLYLMTPDAAQAKNRREAFDFYALISAKDRLADRLPTKPEESQPYFLRRADR